MKKILVYGYGNPGRQDDVLGILLTEKIEDWCKGHHIDCVETDYNYQLNIEDAYLLNKYDVVVYVDASMEEIDGFLFEEIQPDLKTNFSMHSISPQFVIGLCKELYGKFPTTYLLHVKAYEWAFMSTVTPKALFNLEKALAFLKDKINVEAGVCA